MLSRREFVDTYALTGALVDLRAGAPAVTAVQLDPQLNPDGYLDVGDRIQLTLTNAAFIGNEPIESYAYVAVTRIARDFTNGYEDVSVEGGLLAPMTLRLHFQPA